MLVGMFVVLLLLMTVTRALFMLNNLDAAAGITTVDGLYTLVNGAAMDLSVALLAMVVPLLMVALSVPIGARRWWRVALNIYFAVVLGLLAMVGVADAVAFDVVGHRLDTDALGVILLGEGVSMGLVAVYAVVGVLWWILGMGALMLVGRAARKFSRVRSRRAVTPVAVLLLCLLGGAGWGGIHIPRYGAAYFSSNLFMNLAAINPLMLLVESATLQPDYSPMEIYAARPKPTFPRQKADSTAVDSLAADSVRVEMDTIAIAQTPSEPQLRPLLREPRPNVLMVVMSGVTYRDFDARENGSYVMSHLNTLCSEGYLFERCYAASPDSENSAVVALTSGRVTLPAAANQDLPFKSERMTTLTRQLDSLGYRTEAWSGGDYLRNNMRAYLYGTGFDNVADVHKMPFYGVVRAVDDGILLPMVAERIVHHDDPFFYVVTAGSVTSQRRVPYARYEDLRRNAAAFVDEQIGVMVRQLKYSGEWEHLLMVVVGDSSGDEARVPLIVVGGAVDGFGIVSHPCSQMDLPVTLARAMGLDTSEYPFGEDLFVPDRMVVYSLEDGYGVANQDGESRFVAGRGTLGQDSVTMLRRYEAEGRMLQFYEELRAR